MYDSDLETECIGCEEEETEQEANDKFDELRDEQTIDEMIEREEAINEKHSMDDLI